MLARAGSSPSERDTAFLLPSFSGARDMRQEFRVVDWFNRHLHTFFLYSKKFVFFDLNLLYDTFIPHNNLYTSISL